MRNHVMHILLHHALHPLRGADLLASQPMILLELCGYPFRRSTYLESELIRREVGNLVIENPLRFLHLRILGLRHAMHVAGIIHGFLRRLWRDRDDTGRRSGSRGRRGSWPMVTAAEEPAKVLPISVLENR